MAELFMKLFQTSWLQHLRNQQKNKIIEIEPAKKEDFVERIQQFESSGRTIQWMMMEGKRFKSVKDLRTGHIIHCVTDRKNNDRDLLFGLQILGWMSQKTRLTWFWWDQPWERILPPFKIPEKEHINGGWTTAGSKENVVHVYRREEAHKVLIHECIHKLQMDVHPSQKIRELFEKDLNGSHLWPHLGEAYTELMAEFYWCAIINKSWRSQMICSQTQAIQIWTRIRGQKYNETTNVFAYYILKWILMNHMDFMILSPNESVSQWFSWWIELKPFLNKMAIESSKRNKIRLGMTCSSS